MVIPGSFFLLLVLLTGVCTAGEITTPSYPAELITRADALGLYTNATWLNLVHYKPSIFGGYKSLVDDPRFFNSPHGRTNPRAELAATLQAFFTPPPTNALEHPVCHFIARFTWLKQELNIDPARLPVPVCEPFEAVRDYLKVTSVTLVFPAAYMNGPASMFGHTLLVFDAAGQNRLLSRAVSYAAKTDTRIGPLFAFAGIAGLYPGYYAVQPYYDKVEQYGDIGHRDVWEYELDFSPAEVDRMIQHAWELQNIWSRYYFLSENCSYNLFFFLDVVRPELHLSDDPNWFIIPIDTVRDVAHKDLITGVHYRPSTVTKIRHMASQLDPAARRLARDVAQGRAPPDTVLSTVTNAADQIIVLEVASAYTQYLFTEQIISKATYTPRFMETLRARSRLGPLPESVTAIPTPPRPDQGHAPLRVSAGGGVAEHDAVVSLRGRIAYHALLDNDAGYAPGAEIQFFGTELRYFPDRDRTVLEQMKVVQVTSIAPRDDFFNPASWKFNAGLSQAHLAAHRDNLLAEVESGAGLACARGSETLGYGWIEARGLTGQSLGGAEYALGMGPALGGLTTVGQNWKHVIEARATYFGVGVDFWDFALTWGQDYRLTPDRTVSLEMLAADRDNEQRFEAQVRLNLYF